MSTRYAYSSRRLSSRSIDLDYLDTAGPRIVGLSYKGSPNLFAELPDISIPTPFGDFHYIGGHRLWHAPESLPESYIPDNDGLTVSGCSECLTLTGKKEVATGIQKQIRVQLEPKFPKISLTHTLINENLFEVEIAPWAITMFRLGGIAIFPIQIENPDVNGLLPDRNISLWPYSHINDSRLHLEDSCFLVKHAPIFPHSKLALSIPEGGSRTGWRVSFLRNPLQFPLKLHLRTTTAMLKFTPIKILLS